MEQITTYTVKLETNDVWVFKYNLNGLLVGFEVLEGELSQKQHDWLFLSAKLPIRESIMNEWRKQPKLQIILNQPDISFENFWKLYGLKVKKELSEKAFNKLSDGDKIKCFLALKNTSKNYNELAKQKRTWSLGLTKKDTTMNIRDLKELIKDLPDDMRFGLIDGTTDDTENMNYSVSKEDFNIADCYDNDSESETYGEVKGKMLFLYFENKLNENPI